MVLRRVFQPTALGDRAKFIWLWVKGNSARSIAKETGASVTTVYRWIRRWRHGGVIENKPRCGRPRVTSKEEDFAILRTACARSQLSSINIKSHLNLRCSSKTVLRRIREREILKIKLLNHSAFPIYCNNNEHYMYLRSVGYRLTSPLAQKKLFQWGTAFLSMYHYNCGLHSSVYTNKSPVIYTL